jgi:hypothetical protein
MYNSNGTVVFVIVVVLIMVEVVVVIVKHLKKQDKLTECDFS